MSDYEMGLLVGNTVAMGVVALIIYRMLSPNLSKFALAAIPALSSAALLFLLSFVSEGDRVSYAVQCVIGGVVLFIAFMGFLTAKGKRLNADG